MGLAWQQAPHGPHPAGRFLTRAPIPAHVLYAEPADRRMRVELAGVVVAASDAVTLLHETGFYPVAYFPPSDVGAGLLRPSGKRTSHLELGPAAWWSVRAGDQTFENVAWSYPRPPEHAAAMRGLVAFAWARMDAFYEEDEPIFGHAADPYHRVDVRASSRHLTVRLGGQVVADTRAPLAVFETGFVARWYLPRRHVAADALRDDPTRTMCPYKGVAHYYEVVVGDDRVAGGAWSYPEALPESARLRGYVSFNPGLLEMEVDGERLVAAEHQQVIPAGADRDLTARASRWRGGV